MYKGCPEKRHRLSTSQRNGAVTSSCRYGFASKKKRPQNLISSHDERLLWGLSETSIVRWLLGICCLFLLFPGTTALVHNKTYGIISNIALTAFAFCT